MRSRLLLGLPLLLAACGNEEEPGGPTLRTETNEYGSITCSGQTEDTTCYTHRVVLGVSMGASGAGELGLAHPELFDTIGMLGIPLIDWAYTLRVFTRSHMGGFCDREQILANLDRVDDPDGPAFCGPVPGTVKLEPTGRVMEPDMDFNRFFLSESDGLGGEFDRDTLIESFQDLSFAYGNPFYYNPESTYFPPGVPLDLRERSRQEVCANPPVVKGLHHREFNPEGTYDAISFCDTSTDGAGFDPARRDYPVEIGLAIDYNGNGKRDWAEPVALMTHERFEDTGIRPNDDYSWDENPSGTAGNAIWDEGEPYDDDGLDGVPGTGDFGEGNGRFDNSPGAQYMLDRNPRFHVRDMDAGQLDRLNLWADAGIRDTIISAGGANWFWAELENRVGGERARSYDTFYSLLPGEPSYDFLAVDYSPEAAGQHVYVRYGDAGASAQEIAKGDGGHVGKGDQILHRMLSAIGFADARFHEPNRMAETEYVDFERLVETTTFHSESLGEDHEFGIMLPPGYTNTDERYPVVYFLHGQGMEYQDMLASGILFFGYQAGSSRTEIKRRRQSDWAKFIMVFPNSHCRPGDCNDGTFNVNQPGGGTAYGDMLLELIAHVDANYRVREPVEVPR